MPANQSTFCFAESELYAHKFSGKMKMKEKKDFKFERKDNFNLCMVEDKS